MIRGLTTAPLDAETRRRLGTLTADLAIVGVNGLTLSQGLTTTNPEEAGTKRAMLRCARRRVVPVVSAKLARNSFIAFASVSEVDLIVTDSGADPDLVNRPAGAGPQVIVVDRP